MIERESGTTGKEIGARGIICFYEELLHLDDKHFIIPISSVLNIFNIKE